MVACGEGEDHQSQAFASQPLGEARVDLDCSLAPRQGHTLWTSTYSQVAYEHDYLHNINIGEPESNTFQSGTDHTTYLLAGSLSRHSSRPAVVTACRLRLPLD